MEALCLRIELADKSVIFLSKILVEILLEFMESLALSSIINPKAYHYQPYGQVPNLSLILIAANHLFSIFPTNISSLLDQSAPIVLDIHTPMKENV